jgi:hypothetical protein
LKRPIRLADFSALEVVADIEALGGHMIPGYMDDLILQASQTMLPFLGAGAGAAAHGFAERIGANLSDKTLSIVDHVRLRLAKSDPSERAVAEALRSAVREREVAEVDLRALVAELAAATGPGGPIIQQAGRDFFNRSKIREINN